MASVVKTKYQADDGDVFTIYLGAKTLETVTAATGTLTNVQIVVRASQSARSRGLAPRRIFLRQSQGTVEGVNGEEYEVYRRLSLVVPTPSQYTTLLSSNSVTYDDGEWEVTGGRAEA